MDEILELLESINNLSLEERCKDNIIEIFRKNVKGKKFLKNEDNHHGSEGQWLEKCFGITNNSDISPDIGGYELKKNSNKITFGDWSANEYIFKQSQKLKLYNSEITEIDRNTFIKVFGSKKPLKNNRYSWSGKCVPKYNKYNEYGQILITDKLNNIYAIYSYEKDLYLEEKPDWVKKQKFIILAYWSKDKIENCLEKKFNQNGFFICKKNKEEQYDKICFGPKINFEFWIKNFKDGNIIFDSGMYISNLRNYSQWRSSEKFWSNLINEEYK